MVQPLLVARDLTKTFQSGSEKIIVLNNMNFTINTGEMVAIIGESGTGKTTLLQVLGGLSSPDNGVLTLNSQTIELANKCQQARFRNKEIGFVFQSHHLLPEFTALENTMMPGLIAGLPFKNLKKEALQLLDKVGLSRQVEQPITELSGGEQQRVALARALVRKPTILLADEPTGNLDPHTGDMVFNLIRELNTELNLTTVMVTHNMSLAKKMNRCLTLKDGILIENP